MSITSEMSEGSPERVCVCMRGRERKRKDRHKRGLGLLVWKKKGKMGEAEPV